jgi:outer membrane protein TolC
LEERAKRANPLLFTQSAQITAAERAQRLTLKNRYPDLTAEVSAIQRDSRLDGWEVMLGINIPLQQETRRSQERAAAAMLAAAQTRYEANTSQVLGELREALVGLEAARRQDELLLSNLLPQAELTFLSALASYRAGKVDFTTLLDALRQIRRTKLDELKVRVEQRVRLAEIERLVGEEL